LRKTYLARPLAERAELVQAEDRLALISWRAASFLERQVSKESSNFDCVTSTCRSCHRTAQPPVSDTEKPGPLALSAATLAYPVRPGKRWPVLSEDASVC